MFVFFAYATVNEAQFLNITFLLTLFAAATGVFGILIVPLLRFIYASL